MRNIVCFAAVACLAASACAPSTNLAGMRRSQANVEGLDRALVSPDRAALHRLVSDDLVWVRGSGKVAGKAEFMQALIRPALTPSNTRLYASGVLELWMGTNALRGVDEAEAFVDRHHFADLWELRRGRWVLVYVQVTRAPTAGIH